MKTPVALILLMIYVFGDGLARFIDHDDSVVTVLSGSFYALEDVSGQRSQRLSRRHLGSINNTRVQALRLDLGPDVAALDMELSQDSVWTADSVVVVRRGDEVEEVYNAVDSACFLSGPLTSHDGAASLNRCGRLSGMIQTGDFHYEIEEAEDEGEDSEFTNVKVSVRRSEEVNTENSHAILNDDLLGREDDQEDFDRDGPTKRQTNGITAEIATFLDSNFANYMRNMRGKSTTAVLTQWIISKWNVIRNIYGKANEIGVPFTLQLKKVEIWWQNPTYYARLGPMQTTDNFLTSFCGNSSDYPNYDHLMLYTQGTGTHEMGLAYMNGICRSGSKCALVKSKTDSVKIELHEFGHIMGIDHDPDIQPCTDPSGEGGFMGWGSNYRILDCYRRVLLQTIREPEASCLYERNVNLPVLNPGTNAQRKTPKTKKQRKNKKSRKNKNRFRGRN